MRINNINDIKSFSGEFSLITPGRYDLMITKAEEKVAQSSGNTFISLQLSIMNEDEENSFKGRKLWTNITQNEVGLGILKSILEVNNSDLINLSGEVDLDPGTLVGMKVNGKVITVVKEGVEKNELRNFKPVSEEFAEATIDMFNKQGAAAAVGAPGTLLGNDLASPFN